MHVDLVEIAEQSTGRPPGPLAVAGGHQQLDRPSPAFRAAELHNMTLVLRRLAERVVCEIGVELQQILSGAIDDAVAAIYGRAVTHQQQTAQWSTDEASAELEVLIPDAARREELLRALARRFDDEQRRLIGAIGEELVVTALRAELNGLGYPDLARSVRHLSLESDQLGYDIAAPRIAGADRLIEVKAATAIEGGVASIYLSRNEAEIARRYRDWSLVLCLVTDQVRREGAVVGWQAASALEPAFPIDSPGGRWESAALWLGVSSLVPGLPPAVT
jgi:hypothetical protein